MNIHTPSVVKAGGIAVAVSLVLALLGAIPVLGCLFLPLLCLGWVLIPLGAGLGYGYLAPGKETLQESAIGGALAGGFGGLVYGIVSGIVGMITNAGAMAMLENPDMVPAGLAGGVGGFLVSLCVPVLGGLLFGALGGVLWPMVQGNRI